MKRVEVEIGEKLDQALRMLAMIAVKGLPQTEQIATLSQVGMAPKDIASALGTTSNTVRVALVSIRKSGRQKKRRIVGLKEE